MTKEREWMTPQDANYDLDSSPTVIGIYKQYQLNNFIKSVFDVSNEKISRQGEKCLYRYFQRKADKAIPDEYEVYRSIWFQMIVLRGDTLFNAKGNKLSAIIKLAELSEKQMKKFSEGHHALENFGLILRTGGLQLYKNNADMDRPDVFLNNMNCLFKYLKKEKLKIESLKNKILEHKDNSVIEISNELAINSTSKILSYATELNRTALIVFCSEFNDAYEYASVMWNMQNKDLIDDMLKLGEKRLQTKELAQEYIDLAFRFWESRDFSRLQQNRIDSVHKIR